jgi:hypothetical protein
MLLAHNHRQYRREKTHRYRLCDIQTEKSKQLASFLRIHMIRLKGQLYIRSYCERFTLLGKFIPHRLKVVRDI